MSLHNITFTPNRGLGSVLFTFTEAEIEAVMGKSGRSMAYVFLRKWMKICSYRNTLSICPTKNCSKTL
ncbi:MAG: hypothetical protein LBR64_08905 [Dysgonamonadaceae bacterium]|nr:hypothetical protein [Dysgonamonadaceae bacterium]